MFEESRSTGIGLKICQIEARLALQTVLCNIALFYFVDEKGRSDFVPSKFITHC